jgi:hypothetical protein
VRGYRDRPLPKFEEAGSFSKAIARDGLIGTALDDTNEYGPNAMIVILMIVATITGGYNSSIPLPLVTAIIRSVFNSVEGNIQTLQS